MKGKGINIIYGNHLLEPTIKTLDNNNKILDEPPSLHATLSSENQIADTDDPFGISVALDGDTKLVDASLNDIGGNLMSFSNPLSTTSLAIKR